MRPASTRSRPVPRLAALVPLSLVAAAAASLVAAFAACSPVAGQEWSAEATYTGEWMAVTAGGIERGDTFLGNLDLTLELRDPERGLTLFGYLLANHGGEPSVLAGDAQGVSNIEAPDALRLFEAWLEKEVPDRGLSFLLGLWDLNSEFDVVETGEVFAHSSFGIGPDFSQSGLAGPSIFPVTSLAFRARWLPTPDLYVQGAVLDAVPGDPADPRATSIRLSADEGALLTLEAAWLPRVGDGDTGGTAAVEIEEGAEAPQEAEAREEAPAAGARAKVAAGLWYYTRPFPETDGEEHSRHARPGVYALAEGPLTREADPAQGLSVFARAGWADPRVHRFGAYTGAGAVYTGLLPGRGADRAGVGVAVAWNGAPFRAALEADGIHPTRAETTVELTYRWEGAGWALQPDLQWVVNPDTRADVGNAWLLGLRIEAGAALEGIRRGKER